MKFDKSKLKLNLASPLPPILEEEELDKTCVPGLLDIQLAALEQSPTPLLNVLNQHQEDENVKPIL